MKIQKILHLLKVLPSCNPRMALRLVLEEVRRRWNSDELAYGFRFDLTLPFETPEAEICLYIRELSAEDVPLLLESGEQRISFSEFRTGIVSRMMIEAGLPTCYVGVTPEDQPCCMCWLVSSGDYYRYPSIYGDNSYPMQHDEVLCDNIFTRRDFRGKRLMRLMTLNLFKQAYEGGAKRAIAFVSEDNRSSLAGSRVIGWEPFVIRKVNWRRFRRITTFEPVP